jgi:hypothetical protein
MIAQSADHGGRIAADLLVLQRLDAARTGGNAFEPPVADPFDMRFREGELASVNGDVHALPPAVSGTTG